MSQPAISTEETDVNMAGSTPNSGYLRVMLTASSKKTDVIAEKSECI